MKKKFEVSLNTAVFTTKYVLVDNRPITYVTHDKDDGAWQFFSDDELSDFEDVAKVVGLGEIIKFDPTVLEIADMPAGYYAIRKSIHDKWIVINSEEEIKNRLDLAKQPIVWEGDLKDDCNAKWAGLLLRAEWMDKNIWWWCVYDMMRNEIQIDSSNEHEEKCLSAEEARKAAEKVAKNYLGI